MDLSGQASQARFASYAEALVEVIGHADRAGPLYDYCVGLPFAMSHQELGFVLRPVDRGLPVATKNIEVRILLDGNHCQLIRNGSPVVNPEHSAPGSVMTRVRSVITWWVIRTLSPGRHARRLVAVRD
jgi:hypothetical protein